jgi:hypothetical protein
VLGGEGGIAVEEDALATLAAFFTFALKSSIVFFLAVLLD